MADLRLYAAAATGLLAAACASLPAPPSSPPQAMASDTRESFAAPVAAWPSDRWWAAYGDAQLTALIEEGLAGAPTMALAQARLKRAAALVGEATADQLPNLDASGALARSKASYNAGMFVPQSLRGWNDVARVQLDLSYEIDFWRKLHHAAAATRSERTAAEAEMAAARLVVSTAVAEAYGDLAALHAERDVLEQALSVRQQTYDAARRRFDSGYDSQAELQQAEAGPRQAASELAATDEAIALTRIRIAVLVGAGPDRGARIARPPAAALRPYGLPGEIPAQLIGRRPDLAAARWRAEAASHRIGVARAQFYPNVNLAAIVGLQSLGLGALSDHGSDFAAIGPAINLPVFDGGRRLAGYRVSQADYQAAIASYDELLVRALGDVAAVVASERALAERLTNSQAALDASTRGWASAKRRYDAGVSNYPEVLLAEDRMLANRRAVAALEARRFTLNVALVRALGGGWSQT